MTSTDDRHDGARRRHEAEERGSAPGRARGAQRAREVVRRVDPWSVFRVSVLLYVAIYCIVIVAGVILWTAFTSSGLRGNVEKFIAGVIESGRFKFVAGELFRASVVIGAILVVMGTAANTILAVLYNLISDLVGGVTVVVEDRPSRRAARAARRAPPPPAPPDTEADERPAVPTRKPPLVPAATSAATGAPAPRTRPVTVVSPTGGLGASTAADRSQPPQNSEADHQPPEVLVTPARPLSSPPPEISSPPDGWARPASPPGSVSLSEPESASVTSPGRAAPPSGETAEPASSTSDAGSSPSTTPRSGADSPRAEPTPPTEAVAEDSVAPTSAPSAAPVRESEEEAAAAARPVPATADDRATGDPEPTPLAPSPSMNGPEAAQEEPPGPSEALTREEEPATAPRTPPEQPPTVSDATTPAAPGPATVSPGDGSDTFVAGSNGDSGHVPAVGAEALTGVPGLVDGDDPSPEGGSRPDPDPDPDARPAPAGLGGPPD